MIDRDVLPIDLAQLVATFREKEKEWPEPSLEAGVWWWAAQEIEKRWSCGMRQDGIRQWIRHKLTDDPSRWPYLEDHCPPEQVTNLRAIYTEILQMLN